MGRVLPAKFFRRDTEQVARDLIGMRLVRMWRGKRISGIIVETEAYLGVKDRAAHSWNGRATDRVRSMYLEGGHFYVYLIYGMHHCLNVVTREAGEPEAVLIRALAPEENVKGATNGPGLLCKALRITRSLDGAPIQTPTMFIEQGSRLPAKEEIGSGPRIGVDYAGDAAGWPLRFTWKGNPFLSRREKKHD